MRTRLPAIALGTLLAALGVAQLAAQADDPVVGTWELNVGKSKFDPGPAPKSESRTYSVVGQEIQGGCERRRRRGQPDDLCSGRSTTMERIGQQPGVRISTHSP